jgi:hypothetical protein
MKRIIGIHAVMMTAVLAVAMFFSVSAHAQGGCFIQFCKEAEGVEGVLFEFITFTEPEPEPVLNFLASGDCVDEELEPEDGVSTLIEVPRAGWEFAGIECDLTQGLVITPIENGAEFQCLAGVTLETTCTISNVRTVSSIPTLSEWGMLAAAAGFALIGAFYALKRRRAAA